MHTENISRFFEVLKDIPLHRFLGIQIISYKDGFGEILVPVTANLVNTAGAVHGGVYYTLCDITATLAFSTVQQNSFYVTHDINVSLLEPAFSGSLIARANVIKLGKRLGFVECRIYNDNQILLAISRVTKTILSNPTALEDVRQ